MLNINLDAQVRVYPEQGELHAHISDDDKNVLDFNSAPHINNKQWVNNFVNGYKQINEHDKLFTLSDVQKDLTKLFIITRRKERKECLL